MTKQRDLFEYFAFEHIRPDYPECVIALIDALRDFIRDDEEMSRELLHDGSITVQQFNDNESDMKRFKLMLRELESRDIGVWNPRGYDI